MFRGGERIGFSSCYFIVHTQPRTRARKFKPLPLFSGRPEPSRGIHSLGSPCVYNFGTIRIFFLYVNHPEFGFPPSLEVGDKENSLMEYNRIETCGDTFFSVTPRMNVEVKKKYSLLLLRAAREMTHTEKNETREMCGEWSGRWVVVVVEKTIVIINSAILHFAVIASRYREWLLGCFRLTTAGT